jgi:hypothetical protein
MILWLSLGSKGIARGAGHNRKNFWGNFFLLQRQPQRTHLAFYPQSKTSPKKPQSPMDSD